MSAVLEQPTIKDLAQLLASDAENIVTHLLPNGRKEGGYYKVGNVQGDTGDSLVVYLSGSKAGMWADHAIDGKHRDLVDLWALNRGINKGDAINEIKDYLGIKPSKPARKAGQFNEEYNNRLRAGLKKEPAALQYLADRGLKQNTIDRFRLGLSMPYKDQEKALVFPLRLRSGQFDKRYGYYNIPGVTQNPIDENGWMKGKPACYFSSNITTQKYLFVCEGIKDVWRHWQALNEAGLDQDFLVVSSTHGAGIPEEWNTELFWTKWDAVYFGHDNDEPGDSMAEKLAMFACREVFRVTVPEEYGKDWTDFWNKGGTVNEFTTLTVNAKPVSMRVAESTNNPKQLGRMSYDPVDINGAYHNEHMYTIAQTLVRDKHINERGEYEPTERLETLVVRSDQTMHTAYKSPAPKGTPDLQRVWRLTDGTLISKEPKPNSYSTWQWSSIDRYIKGNAKTRTIAEIVADIREVLKSSVWLPYEEDYTVMALTIPVTYVQSVFESVPLLLLTGPAGSGKTQMGIAMSRLGSNGNIIGQVSAATAARHIDECRGFVVMDDLEAIGNKTSKDASFGELVQALKVSYNKHSAIKVWTDVKTMRTEKLNFFGVKMINNTLGADAILGSRMIRIQTRKMPEYVDESSVVNLSHADVERTEQLRQELHTWAFACCNDVDAAYKEIYGGKSDRADEIAAPLRVLAQMVGDEKVSGELETALARQATKVIESDDPVDTMKEALENLIVQGFSTVTLSHIAMEMRTLLDSNFGQGYSGEVPEWSRPEWLGRMLRSNDWVEHKPAGRKRFFGKNLRLINISSRFIGEVRDRFVKEGKDIEAIGTRQADEFCQGCSGCQYRNAGCELMVLREQFNK